jgi:hypothetical protein
MSCPTIGLPGPTDIEISRRRGHFERWLLVDQGTGADVPVTGSVFGFEARLDVGSADPDIEAGMEADADDTGFWLDPDVDNAVQFLLLPAALAALSPAETSILTYSLWRREPGDPATLMPVIRRGRLIVLPD